jgi:hypothetical protein
MFFCCSCLLFVVSLQCYSKCDSVTVSSFIWIFKNLVYDLCGWDVCIYNVFSVFYMLLVRCCFQLSLYVEDSPETRSLKIRYVPRCFVLLLDFFLIFWIFKFSYALVAYIPLWMSECVNWIIVGYSVSSWIISFDTRAGLLLKTNNFIN